MPDPAQSDDIVEKASVNVRFTIENHEVDAKFEVPPGPARWDDLLSGMRALAETAVFLGTKRVQGGGQEIACKAGCGACCRQFVPIAEFEARRIADVVRAMPEPRQSQVRQRFADARAKLEEGGLLETLEERSAVPAERAGELGSTYFSLGIPCPFLEDESCSIYEERPIRCREYLVTSSPELCSNPVEEDIDPVPLPLYVASANSRLEADGQIRWVALSLALDWAEANPAESRERSGNELLHDFLVKATQRQPANPTVGPE